MVSYGKSYCVMEGHTHTKSAVLGFAAGGGGPPLGGGGGPPIGGGGGLDMMD